MKLSTQKIPYKISEYITKHYKEDFLFEVKDVIQTAGQEFYIVEVSKDDYLYTLKFNEQGNLVEENTENAFPEED